MSAPVSTINAPQRTLKSILEGQAGPLGEAHHYQQLGAQPPAFGGFLDDTIQLANGVR